MYEIPSLPFNSLPRPSSIFSYCDRVIVYLLIVFTEKREREKSLQTARGSQKSTDVVAENAGIQKIISSAADSSKACILRIASFV